MSKLLKAYKRTADGEVFAVLLDDNGDQYRVYTRSLVTSLYLDDLLEEGYQLTALPYTFTRDGVDVLSTLPVEIWEPTMDEEQELMDLNSEPLSAEELNERMTLSEASYMKLSEGKYTIYTREDLLRYLESYDQISLEEDFLPLNYFVHPNALFSYTELMSSANSKYLRIINKRRNYTYVRFLRLKEFLKAHGLKENFTPLDLVDCYFQWGIDGIKTNIINKRLEPSMFQLGIAAVSAEDKDLFRACEYEYGLVDHDLGIHVPEYSKSKNWTFNEDKSLVQQRIISRPPEETVVAKLKTPSREDTYILETADGIFQYSATILIMNDRTYSALYVTGSDEVHAPVNTIYWADNMKERLEENIKLHALAKKIAKMCTDDTPVSSYKALQEVGCSPLAALLYLINHHTGIDPVDHRFDIGSTPSENDMKVNILPYEVESWLAGNSIDGNDPEETKATVLSDFINGTINLNGVAAGEQLDESFGAEDIYYELYCLRWVLGIPYDKLYERFDQMDTTDTGIYFEGNGLSHVFEIPKIDNKVRGYFQDIVYYRRQQLREARMYLHVQLIARELSTEESSPNHVGVEVLTFTLSSKQTQILLLELEDKYCAAIDANVSDLRKAESRKANKRAFAATNFFNIAINGCIHYPDDLNTPDEMVDRTPYINAITTKIGSTIKAADDIIDSDGTFLKYCDNADITPMRVIPHKGVKGIREYAFNCLWNDWLRDPDDPRNPNKVNPLRPKLLELGRLPYNGNFNCWEDRYTTEWLTQYNASSDFYEHDVKSLAGYNTYAQDYRKSVSEYEYFTTPPHPFYVAYPRMKSMEMDDTEEDERKLSSTQLRTGAPKYKLAPPRSITYEDVLPEDVTNVRIEGDKTGFTKFLGFSAEDFYYIPDLVSQTFPRSSSTIRVWDNSTFILDDGPHNYRDILTLDNTKYSVRHLYGRTYLLTDQVGTVWRCIV